MPERHPDHDLIQGEWTERSLVEKLLEPVEKPPPRPWKVVAAVGFVLTLAWLYAIFVTFRVMGRNYDAAVLAAGHCGFGLGATPTAIANMQAITQRFGPSHLAFLVVPMVGAFFIDIINAVVIKLFLALPFL